MTLHVLFFPCTFVPFSVPAPLRCFPCPWSAFRSLYLVPVSVPRPGGAALCPAPGYSLLRHCPSSDMPLVHAVLWAFMFLPHNVLQARGTRCPEHPPVVTGICQEPGFFPHPPAWQPFPAAPERSFPHCSCPQSARLSLVIVPSPGNAAEQGQGAWQCFSVTKKRCVRGLDCK